MPTDLQLIDAFEALREAFIEANPGLASAAREAAPDAGAAPEPGPALEAWLAAVTGVTPDGSAQRRWIRQVARAALSGPGANGAAREDTGLPAPLLDRHPDLLDRAQEAGARLNAAADGSGRVCLSPRPATAAAEAAAWRKVLPSLGGLAAWRFLHHLGRPVLVPEAAVRRFFWRAGLIDEASAQSPRGAAKVMEAAERLARVTGGDFPELNRLIGWHTRARPEWKGGGRCGRTPRCEGCPFAGPCLWFRYHGAKGGVAEATPAYGSEIRRIKERLGREGLGQLSDAELLALVLPAGRDARDPVELAEGLIRKFNGLAGLDRASSAELTQVRGVADARARLIKIAMELGRRVAATPLGTGTQITGSHDVWLAFRGRYRHIPQEHFIALLLDTKNKVLGTHIVSKGTVASSPAHPREVFKEAVRHSASGVILMHNHPTGDPEPSAEDHAVTRQLAEAGRILGIRVLDHIILGSETYFSFRDAGDL